MILRLTPVENTITEETPDSDKFMTEELKPTHVLDPEIVKKALAELRDRPFSKRHSELGRMIKCQVCGLRHRENERKCVQQFAKFEDGTDASLEQIAQDSGKQTIKMVVGAKAFTKKRYRPHSNQRKEISK